jgi:hypothetical protein
MGVPEVVEAALAQRLSLTAMPSARAHVRASCGLGPAGRALFAARRDGETGVAQALADPVGQGNVILYDQHPHVQIVRLAG